MDTVFTVIEKSLQCAQFIYESVKAGEESAELMASLTRRISRFHRNYSEFRKGASSSLVQQGVADRIREDFVVISGELQHIRSKIDRSAAVRKLFTNLNVRDLVLGIEARLDALEKHLDMYGLMVDHGSLQRAAVEKQEAHFQRQQNLLEDVLRIIQSLAATTTGFTPEQLAVVRNTLNTGADGHQDDEEEKEVAVIQMIPRTQEIIQSSWLSEVEKHKAMAKIDEYQKSWRVDFDDLKFETHPKTNQWLQIGKGGFSRVFRARLSQGGQSNGTNAEQSSVGVAVKVLDVEESQLQQFEPHFLREVHALIDHAHPCILRTYGAIWPDEENFHAPMIVTEMMSSDLSKAIGKPALESMNARKSVALDVATALEHLHTKGLVHRDVKPENVLLRIAEDKVDGRAKLSDFGVSRKIRTTRQMSLYATKGAGAGTIAYMPPEVLLEMQRCPTRRSWDVWSFGLLLCFLGGRGDGMSIAVDVSNALEVCRNGELARCARRWAESIGDIVMRRAALACLEATWEKRATIAAVVDILAQETKGDGLLQPADRREREDAEAAIQAQNNRKSSMSRPKGSAFRSLTFNVGGVDVDSTDAARRGGLQLYGRGETDQAKGNEETKKAVRFQKPILRSPQHPASRELSLDEVGEDSTDEARRGGLQRYGKGEIDQITGNEQTKKAVRFQKPILRSPRHSATRELSLDEEGKGDHAIQIKSGKTVRSGFHSLSLDKRDENDGEEAEGGKTTVPDALPESSLSRLRDSVLVIARLLLDERWKSLEEPPYGLLEWNENIDNLRKTCMSKGSVDKQGFESGLAVLRYAAAQSWPFVMRNPIELAFQMESRLVDMATTSWLVREYLTCLLLVAPKPRLRPRARYWHSPNGRLRTEIPLRGSAYGVHLIPRSNKAVVTTTNIADDRILFIDLDTSRVTRTVHGDFRRFGSASSGFEAFIHAVSLSSDGSQTVFRSGTGTLQVLNTATGEFISEIPHSANAEVRCVALSPDGRRIVAALADHTIEHWDVVTGKPVHVPLLGHTRAINAVEVSSDGRHAFSVSDDLTVRVWELGSGGQVGEPFRGHTGYVLCVALSPDGRYIVTGSADMSIRVWGIAYGEQARSTFNGHTDAVTCVVVGPDGHRIISGSCDKTIRIWDMRNGRAIGSSIVAHSRVVTCLKMSSDGRRILSGSKDGTVRFWDATDDKPTGEPGQCHSDSVMSVAVSPEGRQIVSSTFEGVVGVWGLATGKRVSDPFRSRYFEDSTVQFVSETVARSVTRMGKVTYWDVGEQELSETKVGWLTKLKGQVKGNAVLSSTASLHSKVFQRDRRVLLRGRQVFLGTKNEAVASLPATVNGSRAWTYHAYHAESGILVVGLSSGQVLRLEVEW